MVVVLTMQKEMGRGEDEQKRKLMTIYNRITESFVVPTSHDKYILPSSCYLFQVAGITE